MKIQRKGAESAKGYEDDEKIKIKKSQILWFSAFFAPPLLCVGLYNAILRGREAACSTECKPMVLFY